MSEFFSPRKIAIVGPESTGKSTLTRQLAEQFDTVFVEEYGRSYCEKWGNDCTALDLVHIAAGQLYFEDEAAAQARHGRLFCDTEVLVTQSYAELYLGYCPGFIASLAQSRYYDLYLLLTPDLPWIDDGTRLFGDRRQEQFDRLKTLLNEQGRPYAVVSGSFEGRLRQAVAATEAVL